jgi:arylsulfatase A-like enzyme
MYLNASFQRNRDPPVSYTGQHSVDVLAQKALGFLDDAAQSTRPFFLGIAPVAPHSNVNLTASFNHGDPDKPLDDIDSLVTFTPPIPAARHAHLFPNTTVPRTPHFNPETSSGANWIRTLPFQSPENVAFNDHFYRQRLRTLQSVDELVDAVVARLEQHGLLDNTYVFYTTDNGFHIGQHRLQPGKECGFEEDINIPLIVRGPGVPKGQVAEVVTTHVDLAPTILGIAGVDLEEVAAGKGKGGERFGFDGEGIPLTKGELEEAVHTRAEHVTVEFWGFAASEGRLFGDDAQRVWVNNTYKAVRVIGGEYNFYYAVWCTNEHELYDLKVGLALTPDPFSLFPGLDGRLTDLTY